MKIRKSTESERNEILYIHSQAFGKDKGLVISKLVNELLDDETANENLSPLLKNPPQITIGEARIDKVA